MLAISLALVPFVRWVIEGLFRRAFNDSAVESMKLASNDSRPMLKLIATNDSLRKAVGHYINNWSGMEKFYQTCAFATFSIVVWMLTEDTSRKPLFIISVVLLVAIVVMLLVAAINNMQRKIDFATENSTQNYTRSAYALDFTILLFEAVVKLVGLK